MLDAMNHRGPDAKGIYIHKPNLIIGHTRLSLVDLSSASHQPLHIENYSISFNGEIYNHKSLRKELENTGEHFLTTSDTEVIIRAIKIWGIEKAVRKFNGCFAFFILNKTTDKFYIVRDHLGEKQIVYTITPNGEWIFASEVKTILKHPHLTAKPNINRFLAELIFELYNPQEETFFENIYTVPAGTIWEFNKNESTPKKTTYFDLDEFELLHTDPLKIPHLAEQYRNILADAVSIRLDADTEVGSILSGGLDSSLITSLGAPLQKQRCKKPLQCFTIGYNQKLNKDLHNAQLLSQTIPEIQLHEIYIEPFTQKEIFYQTTKACEEPITDKLYVSIFTNYINAHKYGLKAVINGQGSDELWLGYYALDDMYQKPPSHLTKKSLKNYWYEMSYWVGQIKNKKTRNIAKQIIDENIERNLTEKSEVRLHNLVKFSIRTHLQTLLRVEDRLSMANSVEVRLPHIDTRLVELALTIHPKLKIYDKREKYIPRKAAHSVVPEAIWKRKKLGFPQAPSPYDKSAEKLFSKEIILNSNILTELFGKNELHEVTNELNPRNRWALTSIGIMEETFFT